MKNAGMAGAVALVGIGLITIGLSNFANRAEAEYMAPRYQAQDFPDGICEGRVEDWFAGPGESICGAGVLPDAPFGDLDGDGVTDRVVWEVSFWNAKEAIWSAESWHATTIVMDAAGARETWVLALGSVRDWYMTQYGTENFQLSKAGLADVDGDGRRDLIVQFDTFLPGGSQYFWHRNITGGDPLVADINRDGFVNAEDLGLLIASWTG